MDKDEALRKALEALQFALHVGFDESSESQIKKGDKAWQQHQQAITAIKQALAAPVQEPVDIAALVEGMEVSIDVSTGDHDSGNRLFGSVTMAQENQGSKHGLILLVQDPEANFKTTTLPAAQPVIPDALTSADIQEHIEYVAGWNDCRQAMLEMMK